MNKSTEQGAVRPERSDKRRRAVHPECPDVLGLGESTPPRRHQRPKGTPQRSPLMDYSHLHGSKTRRKEQLSRELKKVPTQPRGEDHYMARRKRRRLANANTEFGDKRRYWFWKKRIRERNPGVEIQVTYREWWALRYGVAYPDVPSHIKLLQFRRYDKTLPYAVDNLYVAYARYGAEQRMAEVFVEDAASALSRSGYVAESAKHDSRGAKPRGGT